MPVAMTIQRAMLCFFFLGLVGCASEAPIELVNAAGKDDLEPTVVLLTHQPTTFVLQCDKWFGRECPLRIEIKPTEVGRRQLGPVYESEDYSVNVVDWALDRQNGRPYYGRWLSEYRNKRFL